MIFVYILAYFLIGCCLAVLGLHTKSIGKYDEDMVLMTMFVWPLVLLLLGLRALVDLLVKIGNPDRD